MDPIALIALVLFVLLFATWILMPGTATGVTAKDAEASLELSAQKAWGTGRGAAAASQPQRLGISEHAARFVQNPQRPPRSSPRRPQRMFPLWYGRKSARAESQASPPPFARAALIQNVQLTSPSRSCRFCVNLNQTSGLQ